MEQSSLASRKIKAAVERGEAMSRKLKNSMPATKKTRSEKNAPTHAEIALRAYEIFLERGSAPGEALQDWMQAERELLEKYGKPRGKVGPRLVAA